MPATIARASITTPNTAHRNLRGWGVTVSAATASTPASPSPAACCSTNSDRSTAAPATTAPSPQAASLSHQEKNEATCRMDSPVQFTINAQSYTCADRSTLLIDFLHASPDSAVAPGAGLHGTKLACGQGGCGACTVNVRDTQAGEWIAVNSCLKPVGLLDGRDVLTIEGLGPAPTPTKRGDKAPAAAEGQKRSKCGCGDDGAHQTDVKTSDAASTASAACPAGGDCRSCSQKLLNPSPSRASSSPSDPRLVLAQYGGSQCGFCSPGMVMTARTALAGGGGKQAKTEMDMEDMFSGNLCRSEEIQSEDAACSERGGDETAQLAHAFCFSLSFFCSDAPAIARSSAA
jgi:aerobic-type carbon monoxide dehydrogenase small subunit (CoxS/CutS family)